MSLVAPLMLGLLALGILIALMHVRRRRLLTVPGLMIWKRVDAAATGMRTILQWPRPSLPLLLQLLALLLIVLALAQPFWGINRDVAHWIYVLDNSASMQTREAGVSRSEAAMALIEQHAGGDADAARYSLIVAGSSAYPELARQAMVPGPAAGALARIMPEDSVADWTGAAALVETLRRPGELTQVIVLSDAPPSALLTTDDTLRLAMVPVGALAANAGLAATLTPPGEGQYDWTLSGDLRLSEIMTGTTVEVRFQPEAGESQLLLGFEAAAGPFTQPLQVPGAGIVTAQLAADAAAFDDRVDFVVHATPSSRRVLHVGAEEQPLAQALAAIDGVVVTEAASLPADAAQYDLVLLDGIAVPAAPATNVVWIGTARLAAAPEPERLAAPMPTGWRNDHPLARAMAWQGLTLDAAFRMPLATDAFAVLSAGDAPLLSVARGSAGYDIRLAFDPAASNWAGQPALTVFAVNLLQLLGPLPGMLVEPACQLGMACAFDARLDTGTITRLDGEADPGVIVTGAFVPSRAGLYHLERDGRSATIAVHPLASDESLVVASGPGQAMPARAMALWPWLVGAAIVVLLVEAVVAGRGAERFLTREALGRGPLARRQRLVLGLRVLTIALALLAWFNLPFWFYRSDQAVVAITAPGDTPLPGAETLVLADRPQLADGPDDDVAGFMGSGAAALQLASAMLPPDRPGRIVIASDGLGPLDGAATPLLERGIAVDAMAMPAPALGDVSAALQAPERVFAGDRIELVGLLQATAPVAADLVVSDDDGEIWRDRIALDAGSNRIAVPVSALAPGQVAYRLQVTADGDGEKRNDVAALVVEALPPGRIAVLAGQPAQGAEFVAMLAGQGFDADLVNPRDAPKTIDGWLDYAGIVLMNLPAIELTIARQQLIETAVSRHGRGLLLLGGPNSFGPGGYLETPIDAMSPISARIPRDKPGVAMVFVLDRSSSMKQPVGPLTRLDVAKQAALAAIDLLSPESQVSVVTFDSGARLTVPMTSVTDKEFITRSINQVSLGGGTALYRGLSTGFAQLRDISASARHIVVMTDGQSQPADYGALMDAIRAANITVSSVAIGAGSEIELIEMLARDGGGLFHATTDFAALPSILSQEAMLLAGDPLEERPAQPYWLDREAQFLAGMGDEFPAIDGFVLATPKPEAVTHAMVEDQFGEPVPVLASWQYGNGQVMAMTTDAAGAWTRGWQQSEDYPRLFTQALRAFLPGTEPGGLQLQQRRDGDIVRLQLMGAGTPAPGLEVIAADGSTMTLPLQPRGGGLFEAEFVARRAGAYRFVASDGEAMAETALYLDYPARLDRSRQPADAAALVAVTGGHLYPAGAALAPPSAGRWSLDPLGLVWLGLALLIFMVDLALRYTDIFTRFARPVRATA